eukprot:scaffold554629_cov43-Prasinocladus_malaysianus.AAC.1
MQEPASVNYELCIIVDRRAARLGAQAPRLAGASGRGNVYELDRSAPCAGRTGTGRDGSHS